MSVDEWGEYSGDWDQNVDVRAYAQQAFDSWQTLVAPTIPEVATLRVLDFGCGTGLIAERFAGNCAGVVAVDTSAGMIRELDRKIELLGLGGIVSSTLDVNDKAAREQPLFAEGFDVILASSVCSFLPDYPATLSALWTLLRPGGVFAQWDWLSKMPVERIEKAFATVKLEIQLVREVFDMGFGGESAPVVMGVGRRVI